MAGVRRRDRGAAALAAMVLSSMFLILLVSLALDLSKNTMMKHSQDNQTQDSSTVAVKQVDSRGSLGQISVAALVDEYLTMRGDNPSKAAAGGPEPSLDGLNLFRNGGCQTREVNGEEVQVPYIRITLEPDRKFSSLGKVVFTYKNGAFVGGMETNVNGELVPKSDGGNFSNDTVYRVIHAETYDQTSNLMMGMFGKPCQQLTSSTSSIAFGNQEDLDPKQRSASTP